MSINTCFIIVGTLIMMRKNAHAKYPVITKLNNQIGMLSNKTFIIV